MANGDDAGRPGPLRRGALDRAAAGRSSASTASVVPEVLAGILASHADRGRQRRGPAAGRSDRRDVSHRRRARTKNAGTGLSGWQCKSRCRRLAVPPAIHDHCPMPLALPPGGPCCGSASKSGWSTGRDFALGTLMRFLPIVTQIFLWAAVFAGHGGRRRQRRPHRRLLLRRLHRLLPADDDQPGVFQHAGPGHAASPATSATAPSRNTSSSRSTCWAS